MTSVDHGNHRLIAGKYRLLEMLGQGGMGSVWKAEHLTLSSLVAIKLVDPSLLSHADAVARFLREAQAAASLRSPHVVQILDHGVDDNTPYIVMELLEGESLAARLTRVGRLSPQETADVISQVCRAVARAHERGIVHRDLKPDNIYLVSNDDSEIAKVLDFGIAKHTTSGGGSMTQTGAVLGTPYYMSPEQTEGARDVDFRSDLWALSVIAYECLLGVRPFDGESIGGLVLAICARKIPVPSTVGTVPNGFDDWFARGVARDKTQRFESARDLSAQLRRVCGLEEPRSRAASLSEVTSEPTRPATYTPPEADRRQHTSAAVTLPRGGYDEAIVTPMRQLGWPVKVLLAGLVLCVAATALWLFVGKSRTADRTSTAGLGATPSPAASIAAKPASTLVTISPVPSQAEPHPAPAVSSVGGALGTSATATAAHLRQAKPAVPATNQPKGVPVPLKGNPKSPQSTSVTRPNPAVDLGI